MSLTCSSDANPAAKFTWYKMNQALLRNEPWLIFNNIQSSDSGEYYCTAENELGKRTSEYIFIDVKCESNNSFKKQHTAVGLVNLAKKKKWKRFF